MRGIASTVFALAIGLTMSLPALADRLVETAKGEVSVPDAPQRIIVLNPALAGSVYALGLDVLAVTQSTRAPSEEGYVSVWADEARASDTQVLPWNFEGYNFEEILGLNPDLIIAGGQGRPGFLADAAYDQLSAIAPTIFVETAPQPWQDDLQFIAKALGKEAEARQALDAYAARAAEVKAAITLPPQPSIFVYTTELGADSFFIPETAATPLLFADVGFTVDPLLERNPGFEVASTGDSVKVSTELASEVYTAPTLIFIPWNGAVTSLKDFAADPVLARLPSVSEGHAYEFPDYAFRFDYYGAMAVLNDIEARFAR